MRVATHGSRIYIYIYEEFFLHPGVATLTFKKPTWVCPHTLLSLGVCSYTYFKIPQTKVCEKNYKIAPIFNLL